MAIICVALFSALYAFAVWTRWGQRLDASAVDGRHVLSRRNVRVAARLHTWVDVASLATIGGAIILVALVRFRPLLAVGAGTIIAGSLLTTEIFKHTAPRPNRGMLDALGFANTFPSGHTTIATALAIGVTLVAPRRFRAWLGIAGAGFASLVGMSLVATASHRPSDVIGAALVVTGWTAMVVSVLPRTRKLRSRREVPSEGGPVPLMAWAGIAMLLAAFIVAATTAVAIHYGSATAITYGHSFIASSSAIAGTIFSCFAAIILVLRNTDLDATYF